MARSTDRQTVMARSNCLVILIKNKYILRGRNRFLLPVTFFPTNLEYPFTLRVEGINMSPEKLYNYFKKSFPEFL